jgi:cytoplasmic iron level regulating protein YaaA (DUF328/UPF0246 family)
MGLLRALDLPELAGLMAMSDDLAALTAGRCRAWRPPFTPDNARPALLAYAGDTYAALEAATLDAGDLAFAQDHLRILSGLYGLLRPLDLIQPYRLEMGARLANPEGPDLYAFWRAPLTRAVARALAGAGGPLVNLASGEYFSALDAGALPGRVVTPVFEEPARGGYRVQAVHAKRARGRMVRFAVRNRLDRAEDLLAFDDLGYGFDDAASGPDRWVFRR